MTKNIIVLDEDDKKIGMTYDKRAKGLIKSGRAVWVRDGVIRLVTAASQNERKKESVTENNYTVNDILKKIDVLLSEKDHILRAYETIEKANDVVKAEGVANIAAEREKTIQKALDFYESLIFYAEDEDSEE